MSKAFTRDDDGDDLAVVAPLPPLPPGVPNYVTPEGFAALAAEVRRLEGERPALRQSEDPAARGQLARVEARLRALAERLERAEVVHPPADAEVVRVGAWVRVDTDAGLREVRIVGLDEADARAGKVSWRAPLAAALLGARRGDSVTVSTPRGEETVDILDVRYRLDVQGAGQ